MLATRQDDKYVQAIEELIKQEIAREELKGLDPSGSEKTRSESKPRRRKTDAEADGAPSSNGNGGKPSGGDRGGRRRGLLGRNRRKNSNKQAETNPAPEKVKKAEKPTKPEKPRRAARKDTGKPSRDNSRDKKAQSLDAFDGNMPDFLKKQIK